jgi:[histone H3]-lysine79 N-trimethyltransferase
MDKRSFTEFLRILDEFNTMVRSSLKDAMPNFLKDRHSVPLELVERILTQSYSRTVSLKVSSLKEYTNGTDNVYGELLPRLVDKILKETGVDSTHVFADLGSGVGNVVLQTALQTGCEAWGVEMMPNPAGLARKQLREFRARCRLWGIRPGRVRLIHGSFLDPTCPINEVFSRADTLLINNFAFQPVTNDELKLKFTDLKEGCQIAHLKPFKSHATITSSNFGDVEHILQHERKLEYFSDSVSWGAPNGRWYIVTIDRKPLAKYMENLKRRGR